MSFVAAFVPSFFGVSEGASALMATTSLWSLNNKYLWNARIMVWGIFLHVCKLEDK